MASRSQLLADVFPSSKLEAFCELYELRKEKGFEGIKQNNSSIVFTLNNSLKILSDQLYQTPTRFLLELIQNADDNRYQVGISPSVSLSLYERDGQQYFRSDCNEVGLTTRQIRALMDVGESTKTVAGSSEQRGYIGENGIGFKSVFKVCDVVHVKSGYYEFMLDRNQTIGMILPIPSTFPVAHLYPDHTQFLLEVKHKNYYSEIERELGMVNPELLMFLRKLTRLKITAPGNNKPRLLSRLVQESDTDFDGMETITLSTTIGAVDSACAPVTMRKKYIVYRHDVRNLPKDKRREGISKSEVTLAFPVANRRTPIVESQKTFAFLPIDDFGFKFLIHADFLLVASREGLEYQRPWNLALRVGIRHAFLKSIQRFASMPPQRLESEPQGKGLCFMWPKYVSRRPRSIQFWEDLHAELMNGLRHTPILLPRNRQSGLCKPETLRYVPHEYRFGDGDQGVLFDLPSDGPDRFHLAFEYDDVWEELKDLGVRRLSQDEQCNEFEQWIGQVGAAGLKNQPVAWHERVSSLFCGCQSLRARLRALPIIPLRDGTWVNAESERLYLDSGSEDQVPEDLDISIVDAAASQNKTRRLFFEFLGIVQYSSYHVCQAIIKLHHDMDKRIHNVQHVVNDAAYLFKNDSGLFGPPPIFFIVVKDGRRESRRLAPIYCDDRRAQLNLITKYRGSAGSPFAILDYETYKPKICAGLSKASDAAQREFGFLDWLLRSDTFMTVPRLVMDDRLTDEWTFLRNTNVIDLLHALRHTIASKRELPAVLVYVLPSLQVPCRDGKMRPLNCLALPTEELLQECPHIDFIDLPRLSSFVKPTWDFLRQFGVLSTCNTAARLRELQALGKTFAADKVDKEAVHKIYRALNLAVDSDDGKIQNAFRDHALVLIPDGSRKQWILHDSCVWTAPPLLRHVVKLGPHYPDCARLFVNVLGVKEATLDHVVDEFCSEFRGNKKTAVQRFGKMCRMLARFMSRNGGLSYSQRARIRSAPVFPVLQDRDALRESSNILWCSAEDEGWYIPDKITLEELFRGKVGMLEISVKSAKDLEPLFKDLGCATIFLSRCVRETVKPQGEITRDVSTETDLTTRLQYISLLSMDANIRKSPPSIQVWCVLSIIVTRSLDKLHIASDGLVALHEG
ncbi:hypothetical protein GE09DRAFT_302763 [Coniochaeta sp. 2T2.1]|nr:hypothetical protein GE09DRAFT_302763 [Coniochaeta sp. 2T2.1]